MIFYKETDFKQTATGKIPRAWESVYIRDVSDVHRGASPRPIGDSKYFSENGRGWVRISDVTNTYKHLRKTSQYLSKLGETKSVKVDPGDLIMSICATIGKPIIVDMEACIHDGFVVFRNIIKRVNVEFLFYLLQKFEHNFSAMRQTGTQGNLNTGLVGKTPIPVPSLLEQGGIVGVLSCVDLAIQKTNDVIAKIERLKKGLMRKLLTEGIGHKEFKDIEIGKIPKEWDVVSLGRVAELRSEIIEPSKKRVNFVGLEHITSGKTRLSSFENNVSVKSSKYRFFSGDILYGKLRPYLDKAVLVDFEGLSSTDLLVFKTLPEKATNDFLVYILHSQRFLQFAMSTTSGTNYPRTSWKLIKKYRFGLPKINEQIKIAEMLSTVDNKLELEKKMKGKLERVKLGLMDLLLTGKVRVKVD